MVEVATGGPVQEAVPMLLKVPRLQLPELVGGCEMRVQTI
jgi:hypothetical protein